MTATARKRPPARKGKSRRGQAGRKSSKLAGKPKRKQRSDKLTDEERALRGTIDWSKYRQPKPGPVGKIGVRPKPRKTSAAVSRKWSRNDSDEKAIAAGCYFDERQAAFVRDWFAKYLLHTQGAFHGQPFEIQPWQYRDIIAPVFGWFRPDGTRRFRKAYIEVPKKQGKSTLASAVGLFMLAADGEIGAHVYSAATSREQASIVHEEAILMAEASPILSTHLTINRSTKNILHRASRSIYRTVASRPGGNEGLKAHAVIADELHAWQGFELWNTLKYAGAARREPLFFIMTTAGGNQDGVGWQEHCHAEEVLTGAIEDQRSYALILRLEADEDFHDPAVQQRINPMLGVTINPDEFAADLREAENDPPQMASMMRYRFNVWCTGVNVWLNKADWDALGQTIDWEAQRQLPAYVGMDLSQSEDMSAVAIAIPWPENREHLSLLVHFWLPEDAVAEHRLKDQLNVWADEGHLTLSEGNTIDYAAIEAWVIDQCQRFQIVEIAFDRLYGGPSAQRIEQATGVPIVQFIQNMVGYAKPCRDFEKVIKQGTLAHEGNPVMSWQIGHCTVREDECGNIRPVKPKRGDDRKIDGVAAAVMAVGRALNTPPPMRSYYEDHEVELI